MAIIELRNVRRDYTVGDITVRALRGVDLSIEEGEFVSIMGPSGSGKSTLMNILGCLDRPTAGTYMLEGLDTSAQWGDTFAEIRNTKIGFVFQGFNLLSRTSAIENVELPLFYQRGKAKKDLRSLARNALELVGLGDREHHMPSQLSGGQQQRVAIARAMVTNPAFLLADEPTGNLDTEMTLEIMSLFQELNRRGKTIIMVTHEPEIAVYTQRIVTLRDGRIVEDRRVQGDRKAQEDLQSWQNQHSLIAKDTGVGL